MIRRPLPARREGWRANWGSDAPDSLRGLALAMTLTAQWLPWNEFTTSVRTGQSQVSAVLGMDFFDYLQQHPQQARDFSAGMSSATALWAADAAAVIDTTGVRLAVDIGGAASAAGKPTQNCMASSSTGPTSSTTRPPRSRKRASQTAPRSAGGDFFQSVPTADLYLLKFVLHDWDDERGTRILQRCREAMTTGGRIVIVDFVLGESQRFAVREHPVLPAQTASARLLAGEVPVRVRHRCAGRGPTSANITLVVTVL